MRLNPLHLWATAAGAQHPLPPGLAAEATRPVVGITTDSRTLIPGQLFVALHGEQFDGHAYVAQALAAGAIAAVVDAAGLARHGLAAVRDKLIVVDDTLFALGEMARIYRKSFKLRCVGITGSNGKTTSKEMVASALRGRGTVHKTTGNFNNLIGVPKTLFDLPDDAAYAVIEMGMNAPGEILRLTQIAQPEVGLITSVAAAHLLGLGTLERVAAAKCELIEALPEHATVVVNGDDALLLATAKSRLGKRRLMTFGAAAPCDVQLLAAVAHAGAKSGSLAGPRTALTLGIGERRLIGTIPLVGRHNARNAAGAVAVALALGRSPDEAVAYLERVAVPGARMRIVEVPDAQLHVIDDCYNANPGSVQAALETLSDVAKRGRKIAVLGDMLELGHQSAQLHHSMGAAAVRCGIDALLCVGEFAEHTARGAREGGLVAHSVSRVEELWRPLATTLRPGDWVLVKASRGSRLERVVDAIVSGQVTNPAAHGLGAQGGQTFAHREKTQG